MSPCRFAASLLILAATSPLLQAQDSGITLPENPAQWINSPPISATAMTGKGVVLYFFEEG